VKITIRNFAPILLIALVVMTVGATCQGPYQTTVITATNLDDKFAKTGTAMDTLVRSGKITWDQYQPWANFANRYKPLSDAAYRSLKAGKDATTTQQAISILNNLEAEIAMWLIFSQER
jgi:hypothetical protein